LQSLSEYKLLDCLFFEIGLWFVWRCACLHGLPYKKAPLRAVFRHLNPGTRKSSRKVFPHYMRRAVGVLRTQRPTQPSIDQMAYWSSYGATRMKFKILGGCDLVGVVLRASRLRPGDWDGDLSLVPPPISYPRCGPLTVGAIPESFIALWVAPLGSGSSGFIAGEAPRFGCFVCVSCLAQAEGLRLASLLVRFSVVSYFQALLPR